MAFIPFSELNSNNPNGGNGMANAANAARGAICNLYRNYPRWLHGPALSPGALALRPFYDNLCPPPQQPPVLPPPPFNGGQCPGVSYRVDYAVSNSPGPQSNPGVFTDQGIIFLTGPISRDREVLQSSQNLVILSRNSSGGLVRTPVIGTGDLGRILAWTRFIVTRTDNQPDTCGNPPTDFPDIVPPPEVLNFDVDVNIGGNPTNLNVTIPYIPVDVNFRLNPTFPINVGPFNFDFELGGVNVNINPNINLPGTVPNGPDPRPPSGRPPTRPPVQPPAGGCPPCPDLDIEPILTRLDEIEIDIEEVEDLVELLLDCDRCDRAPLDALKYSTRTFPAANSGIFQLTPTSEWVKLRLTEFPENLKSQAGGLADDVTYVGWCYFRSGTASLPRQPVHFLNNALIVPEGATEFAYTLYLGYLGIVTDVYLAEEENDGS